MKKNAICLIFLLFQINFILGQQATDVKFNHLSYTLEYKDFKALMESSFVKDTLGVFETVTNNIDSLSTISKCFLFGQSNYLELFETSEDDSNLGFLTIALGVDKINGIQELKKVLDKSYLTMIRTNTKDYDDLKVPWFDALNVIDTSIIKLNSAFMTQSYFWFWIMGYKKEYFEYNGYTIENDELTRENYLEKFSEVRANRIIKNFTGLGIKLNKDEKNYLTGFLKYIGSNKLSDNEYLLYDNFRFLISERQPGDQYTLKFIEFETSKEFIEKEVIKLSDHVTVSIQGNKGYFLIN